MSITNEQISALRAQRDEYERHMAEDDCPMPVNLCPTEWDYHTTVNDLLPGLLTELERLRAAVAAAGKLVEVARREWWIHQVNSSQIAECEIERLDATFQCALDLEDALKPFGGLGSDPFAELNARMTPYDEATQPDEGKTE